MPGFPACQEELSNASILNMKRSMQMEAFCCCPSVGSTKNYKIKVKYCLLLLLVTDDKTYSKLKQMDQVVLIWK